MNPPPFQGGGHHGIRVPEVETSGCITSPFQGENLPRSGNGLTPEVLTSGKGKKSNSRPERAMGYSQMFQHLKTNTHRPSMSVSTMLQHIKGSSSKWINEGRRALGQFVWQTGYAAFSVSESAADAVTRYIETQAEHHQRQTYQEELIALLQKHRIPYDERYIWD